MPFSAPVLTYRAKALASNMCSKVLNGHIILTDTSITTILAPEMTYTPKIRVEAAKVKNPPETAKKRGVLPGNRFFRLFLRRLKTHAPPPGRGRRLSPGCKQARFLPTPRREIFFQAVRSAEKGQKRGAGPEILCTGVRFIALKLLRSEINRIFVR